MDLLQYAANLNNEGGALLTANNTFAAFEAFRNSLRILVLGLPHGHEILNSCPELVQVCRSLLVDPRGYHWLLWSVGNAYLSLATATALPQMDSETTNAQVYSKAFVIQPEEAEDRDHNLRIRTYIALTIFNLAATVHQRSSSLPQKQQREHALKVALELYDVGFELLIQEESCCVDDWSTNISLAILNNMAEVHWTLCDYVKANRVLELQKSLLEIILNNRRPHNFSDKDMELFILNTHVLQPPIGAGAA